MEHYSNHVYYVIGDELKIQGDTILSISVPQDVTVQQFFEILKTSNNVDAKTQKIRLLDFSGLLITPSSFILPSNTPDTPYCMQIIPKTARYNEKLSDDVKMDLEAIEQRIREIEKSIDKNSANSETSTCLRSLKDHFQAFRAKLERGLFIDIINPSMEISPAHRKLKYRRLSDPKQKEVRKRFWEICNDTLADEVMQALRLPSFDCNEWSDEEILLILQQIYIDFDFLNKFNINIHTLRNFLFQVYKNYNDVPFHNFRHSFCVTQMMYAMICKVDLMHLIGDLEILVLITSCICHDLDHPGLNNMYQVHARTELAIRYNDISPLENHHCSMAFRILELPECDIFQKFSSQAYHTVREDVIRCILATDMARHNEILNQFRDIVDEGFDCHNKAHVNSLCMILIKVADISNEARPMNVAEPWLDKLFKEFFAQSDAEKKAGLPVTPFMDKEKITKPSSQCNFIGFVLLPLFESLGQLFPELDDMIVQPVRDALDYYRRLNEQEKLEMRQQRRSVVTLDAGSSNATSPSSPAGGSSTLHAPSDHQAKVSQQKSEDTSMFSDEGAPSLEELMEEDEEGETVTEVAVSEKMLKFKISTESSGSKSHPSSRKGSREKTQDFEIPRSYRYERTSRASDSGEKRSWSSSENTSSAEDRRSEGNIIPPERMRHHSLFNPNTSIPESLKERHSLLFSSDKCKKSISAAVVSISTSVIVSSPSVTALPMSTTSITPTVTTSPATPVTTASSSIEADIAPVSTTCCTPGTASSPKLESDPSKVSTSGGSARSSPDLKRLMNRVVRDLRGNRNKIANGVKNSEEATSKDDKNQCGTSSSGKQKESKSSGWMSSLFQSIKLRGSSHDSESHH